MKWSLRENVLISVLTNSLKNWRVDIEDERVEYFDGLVD